MTPIFCDVAVVGGGIVGLSIAYELARRGIATTVVTPESLSPDKVSTGATASAAAGAMLSIFSEVELHQSPARVDEDVSERVRAHSLWQTWLAELAEVGLSPHLSPGTWVVARPDESEALDAIGSAARQHGHIAESHRAHDVPGMAGQQRVMAGALWLPSELSVDSYELLFALRRSAHENPLVSCVQENVHSLSMSDTESVIYCSAVTVRARRVILAAGVATASLLAPHRAGLGVPVMMGGHGSGLLVRAEVPPRFTVRTVNRAFSCGTHLVPRANGLTYVGSSNRFRRLARADATRACTLDEITVLTEAVTSELDERMFEAELVSVHSGVRTFTVDHRPLVGQTLNPNVMLATGTYRSGFMLAPRIAELVADEIENPGVHCAHPYAVGREFPNVDTEVLLGMSGVGLIEALCEPGGRLPPGVTDRLTTFVVESLRMMLSEADGGETVAAVRQLWAESPVAEAIPALLRLGQELKDRPRR